MEAVVEEAAALEMSERAVDEGKDGSEQDVDSTLSTDEASIEDPHHDANIANLVQQCSYTIEAATSLAYTFSKTATSSELTAAQGTQLANARAIRLDKTDLRARLGSNLTSDRFGYALVKALREHHDSRFPGGGNFSAVINLSVEGYLQLKGVQVSSSLTTSSKFQLRKKPSAKATVGAAGGAGGADGAADVSRRSIYDLESTVPRHLLLNMLTARPKADLSDLELELIGELTSFGFDRLRRLAVLLPNELTFHLEMFHCEQRFLLETIKLIAEIAIEDKIEWGQKLQAGLATIEMHEYDDVRQRPTLLARYAFELKSLFLTDGVQAFEVFKDCFKESIICKADNVSVAQLFSWDYDLELSATGNLAQLEMLRESVRKTLPVDYHGVLDDKYLCGIYLGSFTHSDLFAAGHEMVHVQGLRDLIQAQPALLQNWQQLRVEIEKIQQGPSFRGHVTGPAAAAAYGAKEAKPPKSQKQKPQPQPRPAATSGSAATKPNPAPPKQNAPTGPKEAKPKPAPVAAPKQYTLDQYKADVSRVREFFGIIDVPLEKYMEPINIGGMPTHRWRFAPPPKGGKGQAAGAPVKSMFLPKDLLDQATQLQESNALPFISSSIFKVKHARLEGNEYYLQDVAQHARLVASILVADSTESTEAAFAAMLAAEVPIESVPLSGKARRRAAAKLLRDEARALSQQAGNDDVQDDVSQISEGSESTLNFVTAFSAMAVTEAPSPPVEDGAPADGRVLAGQKKPKQSKKARAQVPTVVREQLATIKERAGAAEAAPSAGP